MKTTFTTCTSVGSVGDMWRAHGMYSGDRRPKLKVDKLGKRNKVWTQRVLSSCRGSALPFQFHSYENDLDEVWCRFACLDSSSPIQMRRDLP